MNMKLISRALAGATLLAASTLSFAADKVNVDNFVRAETDQTMVRYDKLGAFGQFFHMRQPTEIDAQKVIRMNLDTLYSFGIFDLDAGPVTINKPEPDGRFQSMQVFNQDHYSWTEHDSGSTTLTKEKVGTRYTIVLFRTFVDASNKVDIKLANAAQDMITIQQAKKGSLELPEWDVASLNDVRAAILQVGRYMPNAEKAFGVPGEVDPVRHFIGTALGWGGNPDYAAAYDNVVPAKNDGKTPYILTVKDVPVDGFWSVTVYNEKGFMEKNEYNAYAFNNVTADKNKDGSMTIHFGGDPKASNYLPITKDWNYVVRMYQPGEDIQNGSYQFPKALPAK